MEMVAGNIEARISRDRFSRVGDVGLLPFGDGDIHTTPGSGFNLDEQLEIACGVTSGDGLGDDRETTL